MASTNTLKQRFIDILFDTDDDSKETKKVEEQKTIKASDLLYAKKEKKENSPFINLEQDKKEEKKVKIETIDVKPSTKEDYNEIYTYAPNLSPIFGDIDSPKKKHKSSTNESSVDYAAVEKPNNSYLGIVISPIFGYDSKGADKAREAFVKKNEEKPTNDIVRDFDDIFAGEEYKQDVKEESNDHFETSEINLFSEEFYNEGN